MATYRVKAVAHLTGIRPELLRMWERRYNLFKPQRSGNRYREYDDEDIELLRHLRQQIEQGRTIGELAAEGREALLSQIKTPVSSEASRLANETENLIDELLSYIAQLDKERLEFRLAEVVTFTSSNTLFTTIVPLLMHRLGMAWDHGEASIISGYFATEVFKQRLLALLRTPVAAAGAPILVCASPSGEAHELGLLTFAYTMQQRGWDIYYMGANLPITALAEGCERLQPALVALSLTYVSEPDACLSMLHDIDTQLAARYPTCVGGQAVKYACHMFQPSDLMLIDSVSMAHQQTQHLYKRTHTFG